MIIRHANDQNKYINLIDEADGKFFGFSNEKKKFKNKFLEV